MAVDPVCKMDINEEDASGKVEYNGRTYVFCSPGCRDEFEKNPEKYTAEGE